MKKLRGTTIGSQEIRSVVQVLFFCVVCYIGFRFAQFATALEKGMVPVVDRPPGVEAFLPISALVSLKYFVLTHVINEIHPSGLVLFLLICTTALIVKKGFCSWVCPFGLLSEYLLTLHKLIFKNSLHLPGWLDRLLRSTKYFLALFFIWSIFFKMPLEAIEAFIYSPYNILADIKLFQFFTHISKTACAIIIIIIVLSVVIKNFWCRYVCPYGAVLGVLSFLSLGRIRYSPSHCSHCGKCEKVCPGQISIQQGKSSFSSECSACLQCLDTCPEKGALTYSFPGNTGSFKSVAMSIFFIGLFTLGIGIANMTGYWENKVSKRTYFFHMMTQGLMVNINYNPDQSQVQRIKRMKQMLDMMRNQKKQP